MLTDKSGRFKHNHIFLPLLVAIVAVALAVPAIVFAASPGIYKDGVKIADFDKELKAALSGMLPKQAPRQATAGTSLYDQIVGQRDPQKTEAQRDYGNLVLKCRDLVLAKGNVSRTDDQVAAALVGLTESLEIANRRLTGYFGLIEKELGAANQPQVMRDRHAEMMRRHAEASTILIELVRRIENAVVVGDKSGQMESLDQLRQFLIDNPVELEAPVHSYGKAPTMMEIVPAPVIGVNEAAARTKSLSPGISAASGPDPADLQETIDVKFTQQIIDLAASLDHSPAKIYEWVHNNTSFEPYLGSRKGSQQTLKHQAGNDYDIASLLIALLRTSGIPARYARGTVQMDVNDAMSWLGFEDAGNAGAILTTAGMEGVAISDGFNIVAIQARRVWVEAWLPAINYRGTVNDSVGFAWVPMDAAFKLYDWVDGFNVPNETGFDANPFVDQYISTFHTETVFEFFKQQMLDSLLVLHPGSVEDDLTRHATLIEHNDGILPGTLPYTLIAQDTVFSAIPNDKRYMIRFHIYNGGVDLDYTTSLPEIVLKQVTISYIGASAADQAIIDTAGSIFKVTTPWLVFVKPVLRIDGCIVATGTGSIQMGRQHNSDMHFTPPVGASQQQLQVSNVITAGNSQGIGIDTEDAFPAEFDQPQTACAEDYLNQVLHQTALTYVHNVDVVGDDMAELMHFRIMNDISEAIVENQLTVLFSGGSPISFDWVGMIVDADRKIIGPFPLDGLNNPFDYMYASGLDGSLQENLLFETEFGEEAISTTKILELANDSGITVCKIINSIATDCPTLSQPAGVVNAINNALAQGHQVIIPQRQFTYFQWSGTAWIDLDPHGGGAGYLISGGINGGATVQDWSAELAALLPTGTMCIEPIGPITVTPAPDAPANWYCGQNTGRWEFTVPIIKAWGADIDDPCVLKTTITNKKFLVTNFTIKQLADNPSFGPGTYTFEIGSWWDPHSCGCTIIQKEVQIYKAEIVSLAPASDLKLGDDLTINYKVSPASFSFDNADLEIKNKNDVMVFKKVGIAASGGAHTETWPKAKWNQGAAPFPYANPNNSDYEIKIIGKKGGQDCPSNPKTVNTKLVIEAEIEDKLGTAGGGVTLTDQAGIKDMLDAFKLVMELSGSPVLTYSGAASISATFTNDFKAKIKVDQPLLNSLADGNYKAVFRDLRDEVGNFADKDGGTPGVQEYEFDLRLK
ncbi:MAG: transglutaminase family protein [Candidatus Zixiibacteriota bacterium]